jgi:hypothetical protein
MCAEYSRFFGSGGLIEYSQPQFAEVLAKIFTNGVFTGVLNTLAVVECDPVALAVRVNSGEGWLNGFWYQNTVYLTKSLAAADVTNPRIDRIVLRLDITTLLKISIEVLTGTPAGSPAAPTLATGAGGIYEISLAQVLVIANATSVNNAKITDERTYAAVSGAATTAQLAAQKTALKANEIICMAGGFNINGSSATLVDTVGTAAKCYLQHISALKTHWFDVPKFVVPADYDGGSIDITVCWQSAASAKKHSLGIRCAVVATGEVNNPDCAAAFQLYNEIASDATAGKVKILTTTVAQANSLWAVGKIWHCKFVVENDANCDADATLFSWIRIRWNKV